MVLVPAVIALAVVEYQHFERKALEERLVMLALTHPAVIDFKEENPVFFQSYEPTVTDRQNKWVVWWSGVGMPSWHVSVDIDKGSEQIIWVNIYNG